MHAQTPDVDPVFPTDAVYRNGVTCRDNDQPRCATRLDDGYLPVSAQLRNESINGGADRPGSGGPGPAAATVSTSR